MTACGHRGLTKDKAQVGLWLRDIAPSNELRKWYSHEPEKWNDFQKKYGEELKEKQDLLLKIMQLEKERGTVTLLYSTKEEQYNNAVALKDILQNL